MGSLEGAFAQFSDEMRINFTIPQLDKVVLDSVVEETELAGMWPNGVILRLELARTIVSALCVYRQQHFYPHVSG